jgi:hypothetical protein
MFPLWLKSYFEECGCQTIKDALLWKLFIIGHSNFNALQRANLAFKIKEDLGGISNANDPIVYDVIIKQKGMRQ